MSDDIRRPMPQANGAETYGGHVQSRRGGSKMPWVILAVVVIVLAVLGFMFRDKLFTKSGDQAKASGYQSVFLTNGQVYFGKMSRVNGNYLKLTDIFYLQVTNPPLQGSQPAAQQEQPKISLVKLGQELHGPVDQMFINRDQVLFYEDMRTDAQVVQKILEYKKNPPAPAAASGQQQSTPQTQTPATQTPVPQTPTK